MEPLVEMKGIKKRYPNGNWGVQGIDLQLVPGEVFGLLGPNGAGKTTTVKMIAGIVQPSMGQIFFKGCDIWNPGTQSQAIKKNIGFLPESPRLLQKLTAQEFLFFVGRLYGLSEITLDERIHHFLQKFHLMARKDTYLESFSKGMQKKVALIAAVIGDPAIVLFDEPFADLDPQSIYTVKQIMEAHRQKGKSIIISTHFLDLAAELTDRIGIMNKGSLLFSGTKEELLFRYPDAGSSLEESFLRLTGSRANDNRLQKRVLEVHSVEKC